MEDTTKLVVPFNTSTYRTALLIMPFIIGVLYLFLINSYLLQNILGIYLTFLVHALLVIFLCMFLAAYINLFFLINNDSPAAVLSPEGIWIKNFGFLAWQDIHEFGPYIVPTTPIINLGIRVKDISKLSAQASFNGKCAIFWSKVFGYPPIILSNLALENDEVLCFAMRYLR